MTTATAPTAPTFKRQDVARALRDLRLAHRDDARALRALNRAALNLEANAWSLDRNRLTIESASQPGSRSYHVYDGRCDCPAGMALNLCWHGAAWRILHDAQELANARAPKTVPAFDMLTAELDSWF
jgi:hypothetical protein